MNDVRSSRLAVWTVLLWAIFAVVWKTATKDTWGQTFVSWGLIGGLTSVGAYCFGSKVIRKDADKYLVPKGPRKDA